MNRNRFEFSIRLEDFVCWFVFETRLIILFIYVLSLFRCVFTIVIIYDDQFNASPIIDHWMEQLNWIEFEIESYVKLNRRWLFIFEMRKIGKKLYWNGLVIDS